MKKIKLMLVVLIIILNSNICLADLEIFVSIDVNNKFNIGETIRFDYSITSNEDINITYYPYVDCPLLPHKFIVKNNFSLKSNEVHIGEYFDIEITDEYEQQSCEAKIYITQPTESEFSKGFNVITNPSFVFNLKTCKDYFCQSETKVFVKGENIYLDY